MSGRWDVPPPSARTLRFALVMSLVLPVVFLSAIVLSLLHGWWVRLVVGILLLAVSVWVRTKTWPVWLRQLREAREMDPRRSRRPT